MADGISYTELTRLIEQLNQKKRSGTLFLRTDDNHSSMIMFTAGIVTGVTCGLARGRKAITLLRQVNQFSFRFAEGKPPPTRQDLTSPEETLRALGIGVHEPIMEEAPALIDDLPAGAGTAAPDDTPDLNLGIDDVIRQLIVEQLAGIVGPAAPVMLEDAERAAGGISRSEQIEKILKILSDDLDTPEEQSRFAPRVRSRIDGMFTKKACEMITGELLEYVGPAAANVCGDNILKLGGHIRSPHQLERLIAMLANEIGDEQESREFIDRVREDLHQLSSG